MIEIIAKNILAVLTTNLLYLWRLAYGGRRAIFLTNYFHYRSYARGIDDNSSK
jgi:hypothetical protein